LWTALSLPNIFLGNTFHWQPMRRAKMMASTTWRAEIIAPRALVKVIKSAVVVGGHGKSLLLQLDSTHQA